jgi:Pyruvate/2-oxoacid:ferredoxin oxidoreductase delta subunit
MSKTKRKTPRREFETRPLERHIPKRRCEQCGLWFPEEEVFEDLETGRSRGWFCGGCI